MNEFSILDSYKNKKVVLFGIERIADILFTSLKKYKIDVIGYCGMENESSGALDDLRFISYQDCGEFLRSEMSDELLVQLAFPPRQLQYVEKQIEARKFLQELGVSHIKESSEAMGGLLLLNTMEGLGLTESEGYQWLSEFEQLLEDEQSREILNARISLYFRPNPYNLEKLQAHSSENCKYITKNMQSIQEFHYAAGTPIVFYGLGTFASQFTEKLKEMIVESCPEARSASYIYCDKNYQNIKKFQNQIVISPDELVRKYNNSSVIIVSECYTKEIYQNLVSENFPQGNLFYLSAIDIETQYFDTELIQFQKGEVFVDVGVLNAATSVKFAQKTEYENIYLFEPNAEALECTVQNLKNANITAYELFPFGLWDKETMLEFSGAGGTFGITENTCNMDTVKPTQIPVSTMDKALENRYISYIKMDIEGSEMKALLGAEHLIKTHKPKLAISLYHKPEDLFDIPRYIHNIVPEYTFYLRHYSTGSHETVLYAVVPD